MLMMRKFTIRIPLILATSILFPRLKGDSGASISESTCMSTKKLPFQLWMSEIVLLPLSRKSVIFCSSEGGKSIALWFKEDVLDTVKVKVNYLPEHLQWLRSIRKTLESCT